MPQNSAPVSGLSGEADRMRSIARDIFLRSVGESSIAKAFDRHVGCERGVLRVADDLYDLSAYREVMVISFGKAGNAMVEALCAAVGPALGGIVADVSEPQHQLANFRYYRGGHPTPTAESLKAGRAILRVLKRMGSGGVASAPVIAMRRTTVARIRSNAEIKKPKVARPCSTAILIGALCGEFRYQNSVACDVLCMFASVIWANEPGP